MFETINHKMKIVTLLRICFVSVLCSLLIIHVMHELWNCLSPQFVWHHLYLFGVSPFIIQVRDDIVCYVDGFVLYSFFDWMECGRMHCLLFALPTYWYCQPRIVATDRGNQCQRLRRIA